jgi:hypothetical protein
VFHLKFDGENVIGLGAFRQLDHSLQLVIEVPSCEAFSEQDPCVEPTSFTYHPSSRHGEWNPRIIVPIRMGPARIPCGPSRLQLPLPPDSEDSSQSPIGTPFASPSRGHLDAPSNPFSSRLTLRLERSTLAAAAVQHNSPPATPVQHNAHALRTPKQRSPKLEGSPPRIRSPQLRGPRDLATEILSDKV